MRLEKNSLTFVLVGDWNRLYIQPSWIARNVYKEDKVELGVDNQASDYKLSYRCRNVLITPTQSRVLFGAFDLEKTTLEYLVECVNNFLQQAKTPKLECYGLNCEFSEENSEIFANMVDKMPDNGTIIANGYEILSTKISRTLKANDIILNLEASLEGNVAKFYFNEHHGESLASIPTITIEKIQSFMDSAQNLIASFGYTMEEDNDEQ